MDVVVVVEVEGVSSAFSERCRRSIEGAQDNSRCDAEGRRCRSGWVVSVRRGHEEEARFGRAGHGGEASEETEMSIAHAEKTGVGRDWWSLSPEDLRRATREEVGARNEMVMAMVSHRQQLPQQSFFPFPNSHDRTEMMGEEDKREQHGSADRKRGSSDGQRTLDSHRSSRGSQGHAKAREKSLGWARPQRTFARAWATSGGHPGALHRGGGLGRSEEANMNGLKNTYAC